MKIKQEDFNKLKGAIEDVLIKYPNIVSTYETGKFYNSDKTKDLQRRFNFDLLFGTGLGSWVSSDLYTYLNDDHIYTALKAVCPKVTKQY